MSAYHRPILLGEVLEGLHIRNGGVYFDGTAGGGGHSAGILEHNATVRLIATDKDGDAVSEASARLARFGSRASVHRSDFKRFAEVLDAERVDLIDGFLLDLGVSSHQIDDRSRGFSYMGDAPLDMRMDKRDPFTAKEVVNGYSTDALARLFRDYGEEPFAYPIARRIVMIRDKHEIETTGELSAIVSDAIPPKFRSAACARRVFQAIRIEVNHELDGLYECITGLCRRLRPTGRGCILTFHSLEDRIVKRAFADLNTRCTCPPNFPVCVCGKKQEIAIVTRKPIVATPQEIMENPRSKSAKLRIAEKL